MRDDICAWWKKPWDTSFRDQSTNNNSNYRIQDPFCQKSVVIFEFIGKLQVHAKHQLQKVVEGYVAINLQHSGLISWSGPLVWSAAGPLLVRTSGPEKFFDGPDQTSEKFWPPDQRQTRPEKILLDFKHWFNSLLVEQKKFFESNFSEFKIQNFKMNKWKLHPINLELIKRNRESS